MPAFTSPTARVIQHALDNGVNSEDYSTLEILQAPEMYRRVRPDPCDILPRQFGYWFHTGPGFADETDKAYGHTLYLTTQARVLGREGVVVFRSNWLDTMSLNYAHAHSPHLQYRLDEGVATVTAPSRQLKGRYLLGFNAGHDNYAHFVTDQLPLLYYYAHNLAEQGVRLLLPAQASSFVTQYVRLLSIAETMIDYVGNEVVQVEELVFANAFSFDAIPRSVSRLLADFQRDHLPAEAGKGRRLFVSRQDTVIRRLLNEDALCALLQSYGFEVVIPGRMTVAEQIAAFRSADWVIGAHGAAMANIVWCRPQARIIELFPEYTVSSHFWILASHFNLRYGVVFGTSFDQDEGLIRQDGSWGGPFVISESSLRNILRELPGYREQ